MAHVTPQSDAPVSSGWRWFPMNVGTALVMAVVVSLLAFLLTSEGESAVATPEPVEQLSEEPAPPGEDAIAAPTEAPSTTLAAEDDAPPEDELGVEESAEATTPSAVRAGSLAEGGGDVASHAVVALADELTNMGPTEVGLVTNFPTVEYSWERVAISTDGHLDISWMGEMNGGLVAIGMTWNETAEGPDQSLVAMTSEDGLVWEQAGRLELPENTWVSQVVSDGTRVYAFAYSWAEDTGQDLQLLYATTDGESWTEMTMDLAAADDEHVYIHNAAAGPAGVVIAASFETYPEEEPILLDFEELQVEIDHRQERYRLLDAATGAELLTGPLDEIYSWSADGQRIYDPETGEVLTTIPYDVWEEAYRRHYEGHGGGSPLPIPTNPIEEPQSPEITIEYDGFVVIVDEYAGEYRVEDAASGDVIAGGPLDYIYQGPPPALIDPASGETLLSVTWDEWYQAEERAWMSREGEYHEHRSRTALLTSTDGETWVEEPIPASSGAHISFIVATEDGFVAMVSAYSDFGERRSLWTMEDGVWSTMEVEQSELWMYRVTYADGRFLGVGEGPGGPALWSSADGIEWTSEFAIVAQDDGSHVWLSDVDDDGAGNAGVLASREKWSEYSPLVIEKDGYTLTFEDGDVVLRVTDESGATVLEVGWEVYEEEGGSEAATWEDGVTYLTLDNGDTIAIPDEEAHAAMQAHWSRQGMQGVSVFLSDGAWWREAIVEVEGGLSGAHQLCMADGKLIIGGSYWDNLEPYRSEVGGDGAFVVIVGTPIGG